MIDIDLATRGRDYHNEIRAERDKLRAEVEKWKKKAGVWLNANADARIANASLREALRVAREALVNIQECWNGSCTESAMHDACYHNNNTAETALSRIDELTGGEGE